MLQNSYYFYVFKHVDYLPKILMGSCEFGKYIIITKLMYPATVNFQEHL